MALRGIAMVALMLAVLAAGVGARPGGASAQIPPPPVLVYGTVNDEEGEVPAGVPVHAYVGDVECTAGNHATGRTGEGDARVTTYAVDVFVDRHREGCVREGAVVRIEIGDRMAEQTVTITDEVVYRMDVIFGDVEPRPIPTFTPTPEGARASETPEPGGGSSGQGGQGGDGTPGEGSGGNGNGDGTPAGNGDAQPDGTPELGEAAAQSGDGDGGGFPIWAGVVIGLAVVAVAGGGAGAYYLRARPERETAGEVPEPDAPEDDAPPLA